MLLNAWTGDRYYQIYYFFSVKILGIIMIIQFLYIIGSTVVYAVRGNKEAVILTAGIGLFAAIGVGELVWFYTHAPTYDLKWWNFGMIAFIISLIILLGRKMAYTHNRMVHYSKELEIYIQKLQRSEKIEVISQLAASVAHEVRNPLQVSRGFLQLLRERSKSERERGFMKLAIEELDRAANIITDYLSFAKPQLEQVKTLNLAEELKLVHDMMIALADAQGSKLEMNVPKGIFVHGNADKLRQAFINLIKNSLEALGDSGHISLWAYEKNGTVAVHIRDNGEGMDEEMLVRLGEPYFSSKTKGTGLGLMVTFRIIELMNGRLMYKSQKGIGTEAVISLPAAKKANAPYG
jgi:signal transduction histidine kinase